MSTAVAPRTLAGLLAAAADRTPDRLAVVSPGQVHATFAELDDQTRSIAAWVSTITDAGDRVAIIADNGPAYVHAYYGVPRAGRVLSLINQRLSVGEQLAAVRASEPRLVVGDRTYLDRLVELAPDLAARDRVVSFDSVDWIQATDWDHTAFRDDARPDDAAWLIFTSGSTGHPKAVIHTHASLTASVQGTIEGRCVDVGGVYLFPFPMCHIAGYNVLVRHAQCSTVVLEEHFRAEEFVALVNDYGVTSCSLAPTMLHALLSYVERSGVGMPTLREVAYGSSAISADLINRATAGLNVDFHQGYGMTETGGNVTFLGPAEHRAGAVGDAAILRTAGVAHGGVAIAVLGPDGVRSGSGEVGEIVVRGPQVMAGYWRDDEATRRAFTEDWLHTGDVGFIDPDGRVNIVDRSKDVIITGGENVSSREVEDAMSTHPDVEMVAVVGVPDEYWGEVICAVVVPATGSQSDPEELISHVRQQISPFKRPRHVVFVEQLPLTSNGKIAKEAVRALARTQTAKT